MVKMANPQSVVEFGKCVTLIILSLVVSNRRYPPKSVPYGTVPSKLLLPRLSSIPIRHITSSMGSIRLKIN